MNQRKAEASKNAGHRNITALFERKDGGDELVMEFSFSSTEPVDRWYGKEILSHDPGSVNLSRLNDGAPLLFNHLESEYVGVVESAWIANNKGHCRIRFSTSAQADQIRKDIKDGILKNVSVGYTIEEIRLTASTETGDEFTAVAWTPYEISIVTIPADNTVGFRSFDPRQSPNKNSKTDTMREKLITNLRALGVSFNEAASDDDLLTLLGNAQRAAADKAHIEAQTARDKAHAAIRKIGEDNGQRDLAARAIAENHSVEQFQEAILAAIRSDRQPLKDNAPIIDMSVFSQDDTKRFSLHRALRAAKGERIDAGLEREMYKEINRQRGGGFNDFGGRQEGGVMLPSFGHTRTITQYATGGSNQPQPGLHAPTTIMPMIDKPQPNSGSILSLFNTLRDLKNVLKWPRVTSVPESAVRAELGASTATGFTTELVDFSYKGISAVIPYSREALNQSSVSLEDYLRTMLYAASDRKVARLILFGDSAVTGEFDGLLKIASTNAGVTGKWANANALTAKELTSRIAKLKQRDLMELGASPAFITSHTLLDEAENTRRLSTATDSRVCYENGKLVGHTAVGTSFIDPIGSTPDFQLFGLLPEYFTLGYWNQTEIALDTSAISQGKLAVVIFEDVGFFAQQPGAVFTLDNA